MSLTIKIVNPLDGDIVLTNLTPNTSIAEIKAKITETHKIPSTQQHLYYNENELLNSQILSNITTKSEGSLLLKVSGTNVLQPIGPTISSEQFNKYKTNNTIDLEPSNYILDEIQEAEKMWDYNAQVIVSDVIAGDLKGRKFFPNFGVTSIWNFHIPYEQSDFQNTMGLIEQSTPYIRERNYMNSFFRWVPSLTSVWRAFTGKNAPGQTLNSPEKVLEELTKETKDLWPEGLVDSSNTKDNIISKYKINNLTISDMFIVYGQELSRQVILVNPTPVNKVIEKYQSSTRNTMDISFFVNEDLEHAYFPMYYYTLTYLVNSGNISKNIATLPKNYILTIVDNDGNVISQFVKLFTEIDLWTELVLPDKKVNIISQNPVYENATPPYSVEESIVINIGPQSFIFKARNLKNKNNINQLIWSFTPKDIMVVTSTYENNMFKASLYDVDKHAPFTNYGVGQLLGLKYTPPLAPQDVLITDYYFKIKNEAKDNWIKLRQPLRIETLQSEICFNLKDNKRIENICITPRILADNSSLEQSEYEKKAKAINILEQVGPFYDNIINFMDKNNGLTEQQLSEGIEGNFYKLTKFNKQYRDVGTIKSRFDNQWKEFAADRETKQTLTNFTDFDLIRYIQLLVPKLGLFVDEVYNKATSISTEAKGYLIKIRDEIHELVKSSYRLTPLTVARKIELLKELFEGKTLLNNIYTNVLNLTTYITDSVYSLTLESLTKYNLSPIEITKLRNYPISDIVKNLEDFNKYVTSIGLDDRTVDQIYGKLPELVKTLENLEQLIKTTQTILEKINNVDSTPEILEKITLINETLSYIKDTTSIIASLLETQLTPNLQDIKGLGWIKVKYDIQTAGATLPSPTSSVSSPSGATGTSSAATPGLQAGTKVLFKSVGVLLLEEQIDNIDNFLKRGTSRIKYIINNQNPILEALKRFVADSIKYAEGDLKTDDSQVTQHIRKGIRKLVEVAIPVKTSVLSPNAGTFRLDEQQTLIAQFMRTMKDGSPTDVEQAATDLLRALQTTEMERRSQLQADVEFSINKLANPTVVRLLFEELSNRKTLLFRKKWFCDTAQRASTIKVIGDLPLDDNVKGQDGQPNFELLYQVIEVLMGYFDRPGMEDKLKDTNLTTQHILTEYKRRVEAKETGAATYLVDAVCDRMDKIGSQQRFKPSVASPVKPSTPSTTPSTLVVDAEAELYKVLTRCKDVIERKYKQIKGSLTPSYKGVIRAVARDGERALNRLFDECSYLKKINEFVSNGKISSSRASELTAEWKRYKDKMLEDFAEDIRSYDKKMRLERDTEREMERLGLKIQQPRSFLGNLWDKVRGTPKYTPSDFKGMIDRGIPRDLSAQALQLGMDPNKANNENDVRKFISNQAALARRPFLPPASYGPSMSELEKRAVIPRFETRRDPTTGKTVTQAMARFDLRSPADYTKFEQIITQLDTSKVQEFMNKLAIIVSTLPSEEAAYILDSIRRRIINELDKQCLRKGWLLFDEDTNQCL